MRKPTDAEFRASLEALHLEYLESLHRAAGGQESVLYARQPGRLMAVTLLVQEVFFHRLQSCLIRGQRGDTHAICLAFAAAMLAMAELWMWCGVECVLRRKISRRERVIFAVSSYVEQLP